MWIEERFPLGATIVTRGAENALLDAGLRADVRVVLARHVSGDWGDVPEIQAKANDAAAAAARGVIRSRYPLRGGGVVVIVTDLDRHATSVQPESKTTVTTTTTTTTSAV